MTDRYCVPTSLPCRFERRRVVDREEHAQQVAKREDGRVERHAHDLGVAGSAAAHVFVARIGVAPARVAGLHVEYAVEVAKYGIEAPEATAAENGGGESESQRSWQGP